MTGEGPRIEHDAPASLPTMAEALDQIGQKTRARILLELGAYSDGPTDLDGLRYSKLMERADVEDSGRFNYHLDKLVGGLVEKSGDEYWLRVTGHLVYQALVAGTLTTDVSVPSFETDWTCLDCDSPVQAEYYRDQVFVVTCDACGRAYQHLEFPARGIEGRTDRDALDAAIRYFNGQFAALRRGVCPACAGRVEADLLPPDDAGRFADLAPGEPGFATLDCTACSLERIGSPDVVALTTPPVVGFLDDRGVDPFAVSVFDLESLVDDVEVYGDHPTTATVTFAVGGDRLRVTLDDDLAVVDATRP